jgi:hypothetical protein
LSSSVSLSSPGTRRAATSSTLDVSSSRWIVWSSRVIESTSTVSNGAAVSSFTMLVDDVYFFGSHSDTATAPIVVSATSSRMSQRLRRRASR